MTAFYSALIWRYPKKYIDAIERESAVFGLEPQLVQAVIWTESKYNPNATSSAGAAGLMQLMPKTAAWCAELLDIEYDEAMLYDIDYNIKFGSFYLRFLLDMFDEQNAVAAYNAGQGNVQRWLEQGLEINEYPFKETRDYVSRVFSAKKMYEYFRT